jgi:hypothetical protein
VFFPASARLSPRPNWPNAAQQPRPAAHRPAEADGRAPPVIFYLHSYSSPSQAWGRAPPLHRVDQRAEGLLGLLKAPTRAALTPKPSKPPPPLVARAAEP